VNVGLFVYFVTVTTMANAAVLSAAGHAPPPSAPWPLEPAAKV